MKLCLDEPMNKHVAVQLRKRGYDVVAITETDLANRKTPDEPILRWAIAERRALVTYNIHDFAPMLAALYALGQEHWGVILISEHSIPQAEAGRQVAALKRLLDTYPGEEDLKNVSLFLEANS